jgi:hypothetical protein
VIARESDIQSSICDYLAYRKHFYRRQNTAPTVQKSNEGWSYRRMPKHAMRGVPDIIVVHVGRPNFVEVKRVGGRQSPEQKEFQTCAQAAGAYYAVVQSIEDVQKLGL